jgi:hypothetical protein
VCETGEPQKAQGEARLRTITENLRFDRQMFLAGIIVLFRLLLRAGALSGSIAPILRENWRLASR